MNEGEANTRTARLRTNSAGRRARQKDDLRRVILDAAADLFASKGYEGFSLRQVAEAIGYSPTTIYLHFKDKDDLLFQVASEGFRDFGERIQAAYDAAATAPERVRTTGRAYVRFGLERPVHYRLMFMQRGEFLERPAPEGQGAVIDSFGVLRRVVEEGLASGQLRGPSADVLTSFLWSLVHGLVALSLATSNFPEEVALALFEQHMEVTLHGMLP